MGMQMPCGNTAALNNYEIEQSRLGHEGDYSDSTDIAREIMNGEEYSLGKDKWSMNDVVDQIIDDDESLRAILKSLALFRDNPKNQEPAINKLNSLIETFAIGVAQNLEVA